METNNEYSQRKTKILQFIKEHQDKPVTKRDLVQIMEVPNKDFEEFTDIVEELENEGEIVSTQRGKLMLPENLGLLRGTFSGTARGFGFVVFEDENQPDLFIPGNAVNGAMHKDTVLCKVVIQSSRNKKGEGEVVKVIKRGIPVVVGTFQANNGFGFVVPDSDRYKDIFIAKANTKNAVDGHKVVVEIIDNDDKKDKKDKSSKPKVKNGKKIFDNNSDTKSEGKRRHEGRVVEILGHINDVGVDILSIVRGLDIPTEFPEDVYEQVSKIKLEVEDSQLKDRTDLTDVYMVTIDGDDAKDLDDAISLTKLDNGNYNLGVHIADVTEYVKEDSPLDKEAVKRGTSVYLADRVIPMLPHALSNGICSLNANVLRLALTCQMEIDKKGDVVSHKIMTSVIKIDKRMSYKVVADLLNNEDSEYLEDNKEHLDFYKLMEELSKILNEKRRLRGSIEFDFPESKVIVNEDGKPIDIIKYERNIATKIIEEFMLIANETVAEEYFWLQLPFVYRNHEEPDDEKLEQLKDFIAGMGFYLKGKSNHPKSIQGLLKSIKDTPYEPIISKYVLRSMKQARYSPNCEGHYGLAAKYYTHFTSPIRRYPDLQIHRIIKENLRTGITEQRKNFYDSMLGERTNQCSNFERRAEEAERETIKMKKVEFMEDKVGQVFEGIISGVTTWGIYVELPNTVEGMVSTNTMTDDHYIHDEENMAYVGDHKTYKIGQTVLIEVHNADKLQRRLDFVFADEEIAKTDDEE